MSSLQGDIARIIAYGATPHPRDHRRADEIVAYLRTKRLADLFVLAKS
jgi:hypothetical protein